MEHIEMPIDIKLWELKEVDLSEPMYSEMYEPININQFTCEIEGEIIPSEGFSNLCKLIEDEVKRMTDKEKIEKLERENKQLKIYLDFFSKQSEILMNCVMTDIEFNLGETSIQELEKALFDMVFAYCNKDEECPHDFEVYALKNAKELLTNEKHKKFAEEVYKDVKQKEL